MLNEFIFFFDNNFKYKIEYYLNSIKIVYLIYTYIKHYYVKISVLQICLYVCYFE